MTRRGYLIISAVAITLLLSMGMRQSFGLFVTPIQQSLDVTFFAVSVSIGMQNLLWGLAQPFVGAIADKYGSGRVIFVAAVAQVFALVMLAFADSIWDVHINAGIIIGIAGAGTTWAVLLSVVARNVPAQKRTFFFGIAGAAGTGGQILIAPLNQFTINTFGWDNAFLILAMLLAFILPLAFALKGKSSDNPVANAAAREHTETLWQILQRARRHRGYIFLTAGFFVCGFHVMFIMAHFPNYLKTVDMPVSLAWQAIAVIGFTNLLGTLTFGWLGDKFSKKYLLSILYFMRALVFAVFLVAPKTPTTVLIFSFFLGFLWLATVPLTNALVGHLFGFKYLATLAGIVFMSHQLGSFTSVLLAGWVFDQTGSYDVIWKISIGLGLLSALIHLPIQETPPRAIPQPAE